VDREMDITNKQTGQTFSKVKAIIIFILTLSFVYTAVPAQAVVVRVKDITTLDGVRNNQLIGYGLVVGLNGTGDKSGTTFTIQSLTNMLLRLGVKVDPSQVNVKNVAAVMVTAVYPPFSRPGDQIDCLISSLGDAKSLEGGILLMTELKGANGRVYAVGQGPISIGGFNLGDAGGSFRKNHATVGRIPEGAIVEREVDTTFIANSSLKLLLRDPDFLTSSRIALAINEQLGLDVARSLGPGSIFVEIPPEVVRSDEVISFIAQLQDVTFEPDTSAKVVINERTGTVVASENVRISTAAVSHGNLFVRITPSTYVSQPAPFSSGETVAVTETDTSVVEESGRFMVLEDSRTIEELVEALNKIKVTPRDIIAIFQALKRSGVLQAELVIM
jgi:flagellar P-ring protein FlgI